MSALDERDRDAPEHTSRNSMFVNVTPIDVCKGAAPLGFTAIGQTSASPRARSARRQRITRGRARCAR